jgi:threonine dehydratase
MLLAEEPARQDIIEAHKKLKKFVHYTPVLSSKTFNAILGCKIFFKCENLQKVGSFKCRGAVNALLSLSKYDWKKGVATHSSGNHGAALAFAAKTKRMPAYIVMPRTAPQIKKIAVEGYGGRIVYCEPTLQAREEMLAKVIVDTGATFIHPYDNYSVIAGQATCAKEIFEEIQALDFILTPVGGGGLLSGTALAKKFFAPDVKVIGTEPKGADDAARSFKDGVIYPSVNPATVCDGLLTQLSQRTFGIIKKNVDDIIPASEESIISAMRMIWERMKLVVEPSAAVPLAVVLENRKKFFGKKLAIILTGGNVDLEKLPWL